MDAFVDTLVQLLIDWGYVGLFISALLAGSIIPFSSEIVMVALVKVGLSPALCILSATLGNTLGGMTCYYMGRLGRIDWIEKYFKVKREKIERMQHFLQGKGALMAFFDLLAIWDTSGNATVHDMAYDDCKSMISSKTSADGLIHSFAALPYQGEVLAFLSIDPMVWILVVVLGIISSVLAYFGVRAICRNVYALRDFAQAISSDRLPDNIDSSHFSKDELGDVSRNLLTLYRDKIHAEHEKMHHERQIGLNISHELNTPVGIIKGYLDSVLNDDSMPEPLKHRLLVRAQQNTDRLANLVNDVSMVMRLQENASVSGCKTLNFHDMAAQLGDDIVQGHIAENMTFEYDVPEQCYVTGHESLLTNALLNLAYNAAQHSGGTKMSLCWLRQENGKHVFMFADNGNGVEGEHLNRLFDMFYRIDSGRSRKNGGSGLGLPLVHRIITAMGGEITVWNADSGGLKFIFSLPAASKPNGDSDARPADG